MAILPVRELGSVGVITDVAPYNVPISSFTTAMNGRFDEGKVRRAPIRQLQATQYSLITKTSARRTGSPSARDD